MFLGILQTSNENEVERHAQKINGEVQKRGGIGLRGRCS
jgi:hypothetical protein